MSEFDNAIATLEVVHEGIKCACRVGNKCGFAQSLKALTRSNTGLVEAAKEVVKEAKGCFVSENVLEAIQTYREQGDTTKEAAVYHVLKAIDALAAALEVEE